MTYEMYQGSLPSSVLNELLQLYSAVFGGNPNVLFRKMRTYEPLLVFVAVDQGKVVGFKMGYDREPDHHYSWMGCVDPAHRRRNIASTLMRLQHTWLRRHRYTVVETHTYNKWREMLLLNIQSGFSVTSVEVDEKGQSKIILTKSLIPPYKQQAQVTPRVNHVFQLAASLVNETVLTSEAVVNACLACLYEDRWLTVMPGEMNGLSVPTEASSVASFSYGSLHVPAVTDELHEIMTEAMFEMEKTGNTFLDVFHVIRAFHRKQPPSWKRVIEIFGQGVIAQQLLKPRDMLVDLHTISSLETSALLRLRKNENVNDTVTSLMEMARFEAGVLYPDPEKGFFIPLKKQESQWVFFFSIIRRQVQLVICLYAKVFGKKDWLQR
ncbi:GNAT family N-acetyltransferase [Bacillaceae bacterium SIJ1]|uniref:GNAT family N-acetyltransferase n=1 Tax=Litoribacterium kuwaitense TaxID=1398745 RepID=UPI0013EB32DA|nr:GNAT family N-acetyltransferase [Litoribacterium kuwaitense]NGP44298.1 GNAT family N-acetyltransferase [Litoribacterium kuwaitense]